MANTDRFVTEIRTDVQQLVHHLEQAQMIAQRVNLKYTSMGGEVALTGFVWPEGYSQAEFATAMATVINRVPKLLDGGHGTNLYKLLNSVG